MVVYSLYTIVHRQMFNRSRWKYKIKSTSSIRLGEQSKHSKYRPVSLRTGLFIQTVKHLYIAYINTDMLCFWFSFRDSMCSISILSSLQVVIRILLKCQPGV